MNAGRSENDIIGKALLADGERLKPCVLCGFGTRDRGVFFPDDSQKFGAPAGKHRVIIYPFCELHENDSKTLERVEHRIGIGWSRRAQA